MEKYERILKEENQTTRFRGYFYYFNLADPKDEHNSIESKFHNPHLSLKNSFIPNLKEELASIDINQFRTGKLNHSGSTCSMVKNTRLGSFNSTLSNSPCNIVRKNSTGSSLK